MRLCRWLCRQSGSESNVFKYLPAAVGFTIARLLHFNTITMIMFGRWMNALASILLMWIAIRKLPFGKASFAVFGLFQSFFSRLHPALMMVFY